MAVTNVAADERIDFRICMISLFEIEHLRFGNIAYKS